VSSDSPERDSTASLFRNYRGLRSVVLGASGFIGRWVARALGDHGAELCLVVRSGTDAYTLLSDYGIRGEVVELDLAKPAPLFELFADFQPAIVFNLAGYGVDRSERDAGTVFRINAHLVRAVMEAMARTPDQGWPGQTVIHAGSALEYGAFAGTLTEDAEARPTTLYGRSKLAGTRLLARCSGDGRVKGLTARLFTVYGPGEHSGRLLPSLLESARSGQALSLTTGTQRRDFTYVEDVADGLVRLGLACAQPGEVVNLATGKLTSVRRFAETAANILHIPPDRLRFGAIPARADEAELQHSAVSTARLRRLTGWVPPTGIAQGICRTVEFEGARAEESDHGDGHQKS
jgi:UDP-glucose 4-epimerase